MFMMALLMTFFQLDKNQEIDMDYDRTHQSHLESKYKAQKRNGTFLS